MLELAYTDALDDPANVAQRISQFLGGKLSTDAMSAVVDRSLYRNREAHLGK